MGSEMCIRDRVVALAAMAWPLALLTRHLGTALRAWEAPVALRLRYPVLNGAGTYLRASPFLARLRPLEAEERRRLQHQQGCQPPPSSRTSMNQVLDFFDHIADDS